MRPHPMTATELGERLRKIEGQVRGLAHMIDRGAACLDILTQLAAARSALDAVALGLVAAEVETARDALSTDELMAAVERLVRL